MALFSRVKTWVSNEVLTASDLNAEFNNILTNFTPSGMDGASSNVANMQSTADPGGVGTESLAGDLLGEIKRLRYKIKQLFGGAQWYSDSQINTSAIKDAAITKPKLAAADYQLSASCGSFSTSSTSFVDVTNLSVTYTGTGRPLILKIIPDGSTLSYYQFSGSANLTKEIDVQILSGSTVIYGTVLSFTLAATSTMTDFKLMPVLETTIFPAAGSNTYKVQIKSTNALNTVSINNMKLYAFEQVS